MKIKRKSYRSWRAFDSELWVQSVQNEAFQKTSLHYTGPLLPHHSGVLLFHEVLKRTSFVMSCLSKQASSASTSFQVLPSPKMIFFCSNSTQFRRRSNSFICMPSTALWLTPQGPGWWLVEPGEDAAKAWTPGSASTSSSQILFSPKTAGVDDRG